mgnify:CR=1 FL=1
MIPDASQTDHLLEDNVVSCTVGSYLHKYFERTGQEYEAYLHEQEQVELTTVPTNLSAETVETKICKIL